MRNRPFALGDKISLVIERLSTGGSGVGRSSGFVVFVPFSAPGDQLTVEITGVKKSFAQGRIVAVDRPSPSRVTPPCPVFGVCGGCTWQHVRYEEQLKGKKEIVEHLLRRHPPFRDVVVEDVVPSPQPWHYRNRIQLRAGFGKIGFFGRSSHAVVDIPSCAITAAPLNDKLSELRERFAALSKLTKIEISLNDEGMIQEALDLPHGEMGFTQVNSAQNKQMVEYVIRLFKVESPPHLTDLYCGKGNFTFALAQALPATRLTGVELNARAISRANETLEQSPSLKSRVRFLAADAREFLKSSRPTPGEAVVLDPPRTGADETVLQAIRNRGPVKVVYISCDPATFVRDALRLQPELRLVHVRPFDMFPQTDHVELVGMFVQASRQPVV